MVNGAQEKDGPMVVKMEDGAAQRDVSGEVHHSSVKGKDSSPEVCESFVLLHNSR